MNADVFIQAGHEGRTTGATGACGPLGCEIDWTPIVANEATRILREEGISVVRENAFLTGRYDVKVAIFIHFDGNDNPCRSGASVGYNDPTDKPAADEWKTLYSKYWPYRWMNDNFTSNLRNYSGSRFREVQHNP
jgi:N-acetylmuramoyl-L-alanine amidase